LKKVLQAEGEGYDFSVLKEPERGGELEGYKEKREIGLIEMSFAIHRGTGAAAPRRELKQVRYGGLKDLQVAAIEGGIN